MKLSKARLQQIIKEELKRVLKEQRNEPHMVVAIDFSGELVFHDASGRPNNLNPKIYDNKKDAEQLGINQTSKAKTAGSPPLYAVSVSKVLRQIADHPQRRVITDLIDNFMGTDSPGDGELSRGEAEKLKALVGDAIADAQDAVIVDLSDLPWAIPDGEKNIEYYMGELEKADFNATQFVNQDSDIEIGQLDALTAGFVEDKFDPAQPKLRKRINYETGGETGTISVGTFKGDHVAVATNAAGYQTWMR